MLTGSLLSTAKNNDNEREILDTAMRAIRNEAIELVAALVVAKFPSLLSKSDRNLVNETARSYIEDSLFDAFSDMIADRELLSLLES